MRIAIIGSGVSGLGAAWLLSKSHDVTVFEQNTYHGGHANTVDVDEPDGPLPVDTGFIVYNTACYPNLIALFDHLDVPTATTEMSFSVSLDDGGFEYSGNGLPGLFGQRRNLASAKHWRMTYDILRFFKTASSLNLDQHDPRETLGDWLAENRYSKAFVERHILPMAAAIWSAPAEQMLAFPVAAFARFFANHGLLQVTNRPEWRTVRGGSREYVSRIKSDSSARFLSGDGVVAVRRTPGGVEVRTASGSVDLFEHVVIAAHADDALAMIDDADDVETNLLSSFSYQPNEAILHTDTSLMPKRSNLWTSWNYLGYSRHDTALAVTYWMNKLQPLNTDVDYFVTLNPNHDITPSKILRTFSYQHPMFDTQAMAAQKHLWDLQGRNRLWFAGSYFGYGFHEDGLQAGLAVAEDLGGLVRPWTVDEPRGRVLADGAHGGGTSTQPPGLPENILVAAE